MFREEIGRFSGLEARVGTVGAAVGRRSPGRWPPVDRRGLHPGQSASYHTTEPLVDHAVQRVNWLGSRRFWYVDRDSRGDHFLMMTAATGKVAPVFDQRKLAGAPGEVIGQPVDAGKLAVTRHPPRGAGRYEVTRDDKRYLCALSGGAQRQLPLILIGAGLPQLVALAGRSKSYSERLFTFPAVGALTAEDAAAALQEPVSAQGSARPRWITSYAGTY